MILMICNRCIDHMGKTNNNLGAALETVSESDSSKTSCSSRRAIKRLSNPNHLGSGIRFRSGSSYGEGDNRRRKRRRNIPLRKESSDSSDFQS